MSRKHSIVCGKMDCLLNYMKWGHIRSNLLGIIINMHGGMKRSVLYKGRHSVWFVILQGSRQGGALSPMFYLWFINDMLYLLVSSKYGGPLKC